MMLPLIVMSVMPIATQPINDTVVRSERMLGRDRKPGVVKITAGRTTMTMARHADKFRARPLEAPIRRRSAAASAESVAAAPRIGSCGRLHGMGDVGEDAGHGDPLSPS